MIDISAQRQDQLEFIGLSDNDLNLLASHKTTFETIADEVMERFYQSIRRRPDLMGIIDRNSNVDRLKMMQKQYFLSLADGVIDSAYIDNRIQIGLIHSKVGLTADYYLGTYMIYLDIASDLLRRIIPESWIQVLHALTKMFNFDSQLVLEAYTRKEKEELETLSANQRHLLESITGVAQNLTGMITQLTDSAGFIAETARTTAASQDKSHRLLDELNEEVRKIEDMSVLVREISDRTHLLGLNAAIEAAHAGEMGRGFEVVAGEVRKLAASSREALEQVAGTIEGITGKLESVRMESEATSNNATQQALRSEELSAFVGLICSVANDLEQLQRR
ncbi:globin-coupled sensor protein [Paenibacillus beijingensis]|uniref:Chemotaxis protein n=1 Tax=Paenibacillus beijingensis TaxID=1126833 RepID=A0A0D5NK45_9BACL|nr:globin-coupled sensor protein [Paenibacillus beijingensis]AJY75510.1 chemotaxis protein [Paenibacillus beijingensis]